MPPVQMSLEYAVEFIEDDELVEITPKSIRLRKRFLKEHEQEGKPRMRVIRLRLSERTRCLQRAFFFRNPAAPGSQEVIVGHLAHISADLVFILHLVTVLTGFRLGSSGRVCYCVYNAIHCELRAR